MIRRIAYISSFVLTICLKQSLGNIVTVGNASFESPALSPVTLQYNPTGASWTFSLSAAVVNPGNHFSGGGAFAGYPAPDGSQYAALQGLGSVLQTVSFPTTGFYEVSFDLAGRAHYEGGGFYDGDQSIQTLIDGTDVLNETTSTDEAFQPVSVQIFVTVGNHVLEIAGLNGPTVNGNDHTAYIDDVSISSVPEPSAFGICGLLFGAATIRRQKISIC